MHQPILLNVPMILLDQYLPPWVRPLELTPKELQLRQLRHRQPRRPKVPRFPDVVERLCRMRPIRPCRHDEQNVWERLHPRIMEVRQGPQRPGFHQCKPSPRLEADHVRSFTEVSERANV